MTGIEWPQLVILAAILTGAAASYLAGKRAAVLDRELDAARVALAASLTKPRNRRISR
jgi:hypothetical protein